MAGKDTVRVAEIQSELQELLKGTKNLAKTISLERFIANVARGIVRRDPNFTYEEAIDFILRVFVDGSVQGKGERLSDEERKDYYRQLEDDIFCCVHTGLPVHFFVSFLFEMASPDRYVFI